MLYDFEQEQNEHNGKNQTEATTAVIAEARPHAVTAKTEHQNQNDKNDEHRFLPGK